ncbi:MAG: TipAS antibiotic-recognition domain-containing protein [Pseudomonadota bacterium]
MIDAQSRALLHEVQSRIGRGEPIDVATLCSLIEKGRGMIEENWKAVVDRYYTPEQQAEWKARWAEAPADFDPATCHAQWSALSDRIAAALPLDPASDTAQAFVDEWFVLLEPFSRMATPAMWEGARGMYDRCPNGRIGPIPVSHSRSGSSSAPPPPPGSRRAGPSTAQPGCSKARRSREATASGTPAARPPGTFTHRQRVGTGSAPE